MWCIERGDKAEVQISFGDSTWGFWGFINNEGILTIGNGGWGQEILYCGPWKGEKTPYLSEIKKEQPKLYSKITYFYNQKFVNLILNRKRKQKRQFT